MKQKKEDGKSIEERMKDKIAKLHFVDITFFSPCQSVNWHARCTVQRVHYAT